MAVDGIELDAVRRERGQGKNNFPVQPIMNIFGNLTRLIPTLLNDFYFYFLRTSSVGGGGEGGGGGAARLSLFSFFPCSADRKRDWPPCKADSYGNEKLIRKWTKSVFCFYGNENGPDSYSQIRLSVSEQDCKRIWCPDSFAPAIQNCKRISHAAQLLLHLANNTARTLIHDYICQECGGYRQGFGRIEVHCLLLKRRERTLAARSEVLEMLEVKDGRWFGRLDDDSPKVKWMRRVYPRVDYTQAPWAVVMLRQPS